TDLWRGIKGMFIREKIVEVFKKVPLIGQPLPLDDFTPREKEVAELLLQGKSRREIAEILYVSEHTVKTHTQHVFEKCYVSSQKALIAKYLLGGGEESGKGS
ncbi:MAG: helix-turn-helix transcriptional regulator, partial [Firmicutes bacterium]|nr:helix-turn-helix transcriptional regulator [Bacillota bacterium]